MEENKQKLPENNDQSQENNNDKEYYQNIQNEIEDLDNIREQELHIFKKDEKIKDITIMLISETSLDQDIIRSLTQDEKIGLLHSLKEIKLGWQNIQKIDRLDIFDKLEILYLQHNKIEKIENLDLLINLEYLALNNNNIKKVENIENLKNLKVLNLSHNQIDNFEGPEIPEGVQMVYFQGNKCTKASDYKLKLINNLPYVDQIDGVDIDMEDKFRMLGIFPQELDTYSKGVKKFYLENSERVQKMNQFIKTITKDIEQEEQIKEEHLAHIQKEDNSNKTDNQNINKNIEEEQQQQSQQNLSQSGISNVSTSTQQMVDNYVSSKKPRKSKIIEGVQDEKLINQLGEKTKRILQRQSERTQQVLQKYHKAIAEQSEIHSNIVTAIRAQKTNREGRIGLTKTDGDSAIQEVKEYFQKQLEEFEEKRVRKLIRDSKLEESQLVKKKQQNQQDS